MISPILRFGKHLSNIPYSFLERTSIQESARIMPFIHHQGVRISLLDLSSDSTTGTFKDWLACVTIVGTPTDTILDKIGLLVFAP